MPTHNKAFRYKMFPTEEQKHQIAVTAGCCRFIWNRILAINNNAYRQDGKAPGIKAYQPLIPQWKKDPETEWLNEADAQALIYIKLNSENAT